MSKQREGVSKETASTLASCRPDGGTLNQVMRNHATLEGADCHSKTSMCRGPGMFVAVLQTIHNNIWDATMSTYTYLTQEETLSKKLNVPSIQNPVSSLSFYNSMLICTKTHFQCIFSVVVCRVTTLGGSVHCSWSWRASRLYWIASVFACCL